jgi:hypothetical protein
MIRSRMIALLATGALVVGMLATMSAPAFATPRRNAPSPRFFSTMAYDDADGQVVLFGGQSSVSHVLRDTWTWDGSRWTHQHPLHSPPARIDAGMVYDGVERRVVLFGGFGAKTFKDTWTWDGTDWTRQHPVHAPSPRRRMAMAYDAAHGQVVLFGGESSRRPALPNDTWTWDGTDWMQQHPAHSPGSRMYAGSAYDPATSRVLMFGGLDSSLQPVDETWTWDGTDWFLQTPAHSPSPRSDLAMTDDSTHGYVVLYGGFDGGQSLGDTWSWNGSDWTQLFPLQSPLPLNDHSMADDPAAGGVVLFGGYQYFGAIPDSNTWTWDGTSWTSHPSGWIALSPRSGSPGTVIRVRGWAFVPGESIKLTFIDSTEGRSLLRKVHADLNGRFSVMVKIPENATLGRQFIRATEQFHTRVTKRAFTVT